MSNLPNLDRLARRDADNLTARELQTLCIRVDHTVPPGGSDAKVPALLAHIDELYGQIDALKEKCSKQTNMLAHHRKTRDEVLAVVDRFNETLIDTVRNLLGGAR